jgi:alpha/beta superfamily hydrolase
VAEHVERARYLVVRGEPVYVVIHRPPVEPRACVLLCGSIGAERERGYRTLVELCRALGDAGVLCARFDYRGLGESAAGFAGRTMTDWMEDVRACATLVRSEGTDLPLFLWGLRTGAILASECFREGVGDALIACAPAETGQALLLDMLRRKMMADMVAGHPTLPSTREEIVAHLEQGGRCNVDGYEWTGALWRDAGCHRCVEPPPDSLRAWWVVDFAGLPSTPLSGQSDARRLRLTSDRFWEGPPRLIPRDTALRDTTLSLVTAGTGVPALE